MVLSFNTHYYTELPPYSKKRRLKTGPICGIGVDVSFMKSSTLLGGIRCKPQLRGGQDKREGKKEGQRRKDVIFIHTCTSDISVERFRIFSAVGNFRPHNGVVLLLVVHR